MKKNKHLSFKQKLNRVFDDDLKTWQWENVADWIIIGLIVISTVEVFLSTFDGISHRYGAWLNAIDLVTTVLFTIEVSLRIWCADLIDPKYKGFWGRVKYCFSFYGFIDLVSTYSFYVALIFPIPYAALKVLRVFRLLRVFRYMKSFQVLSDAFRSKKQEFWISLQFLAVVTLILSFLLFFVEHQAQPEVYDNGWRSVLWAFAQYIGDPGNFADTPPITFWGRVIAVLVGVLGIAIFAVPAGLIGSGFIEVIEERKNAEELERKRKLIYQRFEANHSKKKLLLSDDKHTRKAPSRYLSSEVLHSVCMLTDNEILEAVRASDELRMRAMKSDEEMKVNDLTVVERFLSNTDYGYCRWDDKENLVLINPVGAVEYSTSHVMSTLAENTTCNIISRERRFYGVANEEAQYTSPAFGAMSVNVLTEQPKRYQNEDGSDNDTLRNGDILLGHYIDALKQIKKGRRVLFVTSGASGRADFEVQWGMPSGTEGYQFEGSHVAPEDYEWVEQFCERLKKNAAEITVHSAARKDYTFNFTFGTHTKLCMGLKENENHIARAIYNHTGATVVMLYLNIKTVLKAEDERYYAAIKVLLDTLEEIDAYDFKK